MSSTTELIALRSGAMIKTVISYPASCTRDTKSPTVLFLHFWGGSTNTWSLVTPHISKDYSTIALDFRGWGASTGQDESGAYSIAALADDVEQVIVATQLRSVVLVGLSMGAKVAQLVAARMCSRVGNNGQLEGASLQGLVLVSPAPPTPLELPVDMREQQLHAYESEDSAEFVARNVLTTTFRRRSLPAFVVNDMLRGNKWAKAAWPAYAMAEDISGVIERIRVPVLVLAAAEDAVEPPDRVESEVCVRFPGAYFEILEGSGHLSPVDVPKDVAKHLLRFLGSL